MADIDVLPLRGVPVLALVDSLGIASNGTQTVAQLASKGVRSVCAVDATGVSVSGATVAQLASAGIRAFCPVDELGVAQDSSTADTLRARGIRPMVLLGANGLALTGSATMLTLAQRKLSYFCPVDESGNATTMGAVILVTNTTVLETATIGTTVGTLSVAGGTGTYTFTLTGTGGGKFTTAGTNGVNLNTAAALDYETATSHNITVSATNGGTPITRTITITVTNVVEDTTPNAFSFTDVTGAALSTVVESDAITVAGMDGPATMTVTGGEYSINGGAYASTSTTVVVGNTVKVRGTSSNLNSTAVNVVLTIGGVSDTFSITTLAADTTPDAFSFVDATGAALSTVIESNTITVIGINGPATMTVSGGEYSKNGGGYASTSTTVVVNDTVKVRGTSSGSSATAVNVTLTIGGVSDTFTITTLAIDSTPDAFVFTDVTGAALSSVVESNTITVAGINIAATMTITGGEYSKNGGGYASTSTTVVVGDTVKVRGTSSGSITTSVNVVLTIGGVSDTFTITTGGGSVGAPNGVVFDGDSLTEYGGLVGGGTNIPHATWFATITGLPTSNVGTSGDTLQAIDTAFASQVAPLYNASNRNTYVLLGGANNSVDTAAVMWTALTSICAKAHTAGFRVWICTQLPRTSTPSEITAFSALVRANWATVADGLVEFESPAIFPTNSYFLTDGLHQSVRGAVRMGDQVRIAMGLGYVATDNIPTAFSFTDVTGATTSSVVTSTDLELAGLTAASAFSVTGGTLVVNGVDLGSSGTVQPYDMVAARGTSSGSASTATNVVVTIGGVSDTFTITTGAGAGSTINWDTPQLSGSGTFSGSDGTFTASSDFKIKSTDAAITGKKLVAVDVSAGSTYLGAGIYGGTFPGNLWESTTSLAWLMNSDVFYNGSPINSPQKIVELGGTQGFVCDITNKKIWFTCDGTNFYGSIGPLTKAQVEAGTSGYDITSIVAAGAVYIAAEAVFGTGASDVITLRTAWPWSSISGYTYLA